jgi:hypothetical protein
MGEPGFTPIDDTEGFTPVDETPSTPKPIADPMTGSVSSMRAAEPSAWQRVKSAFPIIDRVETGLGQAGASLGMSPSNAQALAKPLPGMETQQAIAPEQAMTPSERQAHPIATGAGEFAGGMTTPENALLTGLTAGPSPQLVGRALGATFSAQVLKGAYDQYAPLKAAADAKDWPEVERLGTHLVLGATMGLLGVRRTIRGESPFEELSQSGREFAKVKAAQQSREGIEKNGVGLYNKIRDSVITHKATLEKQANDALQPTIDKDATQPPAISTAGAISEAAKTIAKTGYTPKPAEAKLLAKMQGVSGADQFAQQQGYENSADARAKIEAQAPGHGVWEGMLKQQGLTEDPTTHLSLGDAKLLRTAVGRIAFGKNAAPESRAVFTAAYRELTDAARARTKELDGSPARFDFHNNRYKMSFELDKGVAGGMLDPLQGQDANASINPLKDFSTGNIREIQQQMRQTGQAPLAKQLEQSQKDATALTSAHDAVSGKFSAGVYRMLQAHPKQAWPGLAVMGAAHGIGLPFPLPQIAGAGAAAWNVGRIAKNAAGEIGTRLENDPEMTPEKFQTRTTPMSGDFPAPPQEGPSQPTGASGGNSGPAGPSSAPQGNTAENAAHSEGFFDQVKAEHPDWTASQQLMEAAKREGVGKPDLGKDAVNKPPRRTVEEVTRRYKGPDPEADKVELLRMIRENQQAKIDTARTTGERAEAVARRGAFEEQQAGGKRGKERKAEDIEKIKSRKM